MADFSSSLPVRTESAGDLKVKIVDSTVTSQELKVNADGSIDVNFTATDLDIRDLSHTQDSVKIGDGTDFLSINNDGSINAAISAVDLDIRDLNFSTDSVDVSGSLVTVTATALDIRELDFALDKVDVSGSSVTVTATDLDIRDLDFATDSVDVSGSSVTVTATDLDIRDLAFATDKVDVSGSSVTVSATDLDVRDLSHAQDSVKVGDGTDFLAINSDGSINVKISDASPGTAVADYNTAASIAGGASSTHTYTSTGNFYLEQVEASGSGKMKIEIAVNGATKAVLFNSTSSPNMSLVLKQPILATTGQTVTVVRTNRDNQSQDVYSTIIGYNG